MQVRSGAGEFEITFDRAEVRGETLLLYGKMGIWQAETRIDGADVGSLLRVTLRPRVLGWALARPFAALRRKLARG